MVFSKKSSSFKGDGILLFQNVSTAIQAESIIKKADYEVRLIAPPPELRIGCDLALEINLVERNGMERLLKEKGLENSSLKD